MTTKPLPYVRAARSVALLALALSSATAAAQGWRPDRHVELIVPAEAGGSLDVTGRTLQKIWDERKLLGVSSGVVNRAGGVHAVAYAYLSQRAGEPHLLSITSSNLLSGHISGRFPQTFADFTPLATLLNENIAWAVRADSPITSGREFIETLRKNPAAYSLALGSAIGGTHHVAAGLPLQAAGIEVKQVKFVGFNSSTSAVTALLGGHVDVVAASTINISQQVEAGKLRTIALTASKRMTGVLASAPTWAEIGYKAHIENWRGIMGPRNLTPAQIAFWEAVIRQVVESPDFKGYAEKNQWDVALRSARDTRAFMEADFAQMKSVMGFLGLARQ